MVPGMGSGDDIFLVGLSSWIFGRRISSLARFYSCKSSLFMGHKGFGAGNSERVGEVRQAVAYTFGVYRRVEI